MRDEQNDRAEDAVWAAWFALWNGDFTQADGIVAKDIRVHTTLLDGSPDTTIEGPSGVVGWIARTRSFLSGLEFSTVVGPLRDGDYMAGHWTATGRYVGGFPGAGAETVRASPSQGLMCCASATIKWRSTGLSPIRPRRSASWEFAALC
jgi:hypothetical protein